MSSDVFPATISTWIGDQIGRGAEGRQSINRHVMETYAWPLMVYYRGTRLGMGEPDDVVEGFFASRLNQPDFFEKWRGSGMRLRRWLMNGFCFYLKELRRKERRREEPLDEGVEHAGPTGDPTAEMERMCIHSFVHQAMQQAEQACIRDTMSEHWQVFLRHHLNDVPFADLADEFHVDEARAAVMCRTAVRKFRTALREVLEADGVAADDVDQEIQSFLEDMQE